MNDCLHGSKARKSFASSLIYGMYFYKAATWCEAVPRRLDSFRNFWNTTNLYEAICRHCKQVLLKWPSSHTRQVLGACNLYEATRSVTINSILIQNTHSAVLTWGNQVKYRASAGNIIFLTHTHTDTHTHTRTHTHKHTHTHTEQKTCTVRFLPEATGSVGKPGLVHNPAQAAHKWNKGHTLNGM